MNDDPQTRQSIYKNPDDLSVTTASMNLATDGVLYVATRQEKYLVEARASATSLKRFCPNLPVCVFTDLPESTLLTDTCFDAVFPIVADTDCGTEWGRGLRTRMLSLTQSPYRRTFHLDSDTRFMSNAVEKIFEILDTYEIGMVEDPPDVSIAVKHYGHRMLNGGVILYRKCAKVLSLFEHWQRLFLTQIEAYAQDPMPMIDYMTGIRDETVRRKMLLNDQFALAQLLSPDINVYDLKLKVLDEAWNFCGTFVGKTLDRPIHVDHGLHLKAGVFSRTSQHSKPKSLNHLLRRLITNIARAQTELKHGAKETGLAILEETIQSVPNQSLVQVPLAREMMRWGKFTEARACAERAILADPDCYDAFVELATALFNEGDVQGAAECVERCRSRFPAKLGIGGLAQIIHSEGGILKTALAKPDYSTFLMQTRLELDTVLNHQLQDFILHQQMLETQSPPGTSLNFYRSAALGPLAGPTIAALQNLIWPHVLQYRARLSKLDHPMVQGSPPKLGIASWGTVMGRGASMLAHIHKNAWISGVLYVRVPKCIHVSQTSKAGWIEFGRPPKNEYAYTFTPRVHTIQPVEGMLLLFPAYYWHGTIPHESDDLRISFGFNVLGMSDDAAPKNRQ